MKARTSQAAALHRRAVAASLAAAAALETSAAAHADEQEQRALAERLRTAAAALVPGWLGTPLAELPTTYPIGAPAPGDAISGGETAPRFLRVGNACPLDDAHFPALIPLLGTGHLSIDVDGRDPRVAGLLRTVLLRLLAATPVGSLLVRLVDATGTVGTPFHPLADAGLLAPPATDQAGLLTLLTEAEQWVRPPRPTGAVRARHDRTLLLVVAVLPEATGEAELAQLDALARYGPEAGLHLVVAGWPPAPPTPGGTRPPLPRATTIALLDRYALLGDPPGTSFGNPLPYLPSTGLNSPVVIDSAPPAGLVESVCRDIAAQAGIGTPRPALVDLLPPLPAPPAADHPSDGSIGSGGAGPATSGSGGAGPATSGSHAMGLTTVVGYAGTVRVTLGFTDLTPHWLVAGRPGSGKTGFLVTVVLGLCARYGPHELGLHLVSLADSDSFSRFLPARPDGRRLPQLGVLHDGCGPEQALAVLRELDAERERRIATHQATGVRRLAELPDQERPPRLLCVVDEFQELLDAGRQPRAEALALLDRLGRAGRTLGIHLLLASRPSLDATWRDQRRDALFGLFPVRVALPGGDQVLQPDNDAAAGIPLGGAVINTAGGLGGPRGATRGHERLVRFADPYADPAGLVALRDRIHQTHAGWAQPVLARPEPPDELTPGRDWRPAGSGVGGEGTRR